MEVQFLTISICVLGLPRADILPVMEERVSSAKQNKKLQKVDNDEMGRVTTSKTTMGHQATIESRNKAYKVQDNPS